MLYHDADLDKHFLLLNQTKLSIGDIRQIWNAVKRSAVVTTGKPCTVVGQITSAYYDDSYIVKVTNPPAGN